MFNPEQSVKVELDSSFTLTHFKSAVRHLCNLEKESPSHTTYSKREQRVQVVLFNLLLDLAQYHDGKCKGPNHQFTVSLEPLLQNDHEAHSDIAVVAVYDNSQHLILLIEVKLNLKETFESIWHAPVKDRNAFSQLLHAAVLSNWGKKHQKEKSTLLLLGSDKIYHCFEVKFGDDFVEMLQYQIIQADFKGDDFKKVMCYLQREMLRICTSSHVQKNYKCVIVHACNICHL